MRSEICFLCPKMVNDIVSFLFIIFEDILGVTLANLLRIWIILMPLLHYMGSAALALAVFAKLQNLSIMYEVLGVSNLDLREPK